MPLKPTPIELAGGKGKRQRVWEAIRRLAAHPDAVFTEGDIYSAIPTRERVDIEMSMMRDYRRALLAGGVLAVVSEHTPRTPASYRLARDCGIEAPRFSRDGKPVVLGLAQEQMWRTLRMMTGDTNARELAAHAGTPEVPVAETAAKDYLKRLNTAGYLVCTKEGHGTGAGGVQARYRLKPSRNTGPRPPMVCRTKVVWDPNEGKVVWMPPVTEEDAIHG